MQIKGEGLDKGGLGPSPLIPCSIFCISRHSRRDRDRWGQRIWKSRSVFGILSMKTPVRALRLVELDDISGLGS